MGGTLPKDRKHPSQSPWELGEADGYGCSTSLERGMVWSPTRPPSPTVTGHVTVPARGRPSATGLSDGQWPSPTTLDEVAAPHSVHHRPSVRRGLPSPPPPSPPSSLSISLPFHCFFKHNHSLYRIPTEQRTRLLALEQHDRVNQASACLWDTGQSDSWIFSGQLGWEGWGSLVTAPQRRFPGKHRGR